MSEVAQRTEIITPRPAEGLAAILDLPSWELSSNAGLPLSWHWLYLLDIPPQAALGSDGHRAWGGIPSPPGPGSRRMFAGGRVTQGEPLRIGSAATRRTWESSSVEKLGPSGRLLFVTAHTEISQYGRVIITEEQDIVYRDAAQPSAGVSSRPPAPERLSPETQQWSHDWFVEINPVLLFRFSALTCNSHRIHYDRDYAQSIEGYPGLVVHGPLQAVLMTELARADDILAELL